MADPAGPDLTVTDMMAAIRDQLARRRAGPSLGRLPPAYDTNPAGESPRLLETRIDWHQLLSGLGQAETFCNHVGVVPAMNRIPRPARYLARFIARCMLVATRFILNGQRAFNETALGTVNNLYGVMHYFEQVQRENLKRLQAELARQNARVEALTARVRELEAERLRAAG
jgi:hypothetical protein